MSAATFSNPMSHAELVSTAGATLAQRASKYRGATVEDLDPPSALSCNPSDPISHVLLTAFERDYTHLTVVSQETRALLGYVAIPHLKELLAKGAVREEDEVRDAMMKFRRRGNVYKVITMETTLEELDGFFEGEMDAEGKAVGGRDFAVVTDEGRRFVLGVVTLSDLIEFVKRRPT